MKNRLKALREAHEMTQEKLCEMTGLSRATISKIENDDEAIINTKTIVKIAQAFAVPPSEIFF